MAVAGRTPTGVGGGTGPGYTTRPPPRTPPHAPEGPAVPATTAKHDERIAGMTFASVYPHYLAKVEKKGRTAAELHEVIEWLTGYDAADLRRFIESGATFAEFFAGAALNPHASLITGTICGYRVEEIETPLTRQCRSLDKLVDELARGRAMGKILRTPEA